MKQFTYQDIELWEPCYSPSRYLQENWKGTVLDILDDKRIPFQDRLWVIMRTELVSEKLMRLFAVWCARQVQHLMKDERSIKALDIAEKFARGGATKEELADAWADALDAAQADAWDAALDDAWAAAQAAALAAARFAATALAARAAALDAGAALAAQETKLREMLIAGVETGDTK